MGAVPAAVELVEPGKRNSEMTNKFYGRAVEAWNGEVQARVEQGMSKAQAIAELVKAEPDLHAAYLESYNAQFRQQGGRA